jgi:hypothetical protein
MRGQEFTLVIPSTSAVEGWCRFGFEHYKKEKSVQEVESVTHRQERLEKAQETESESPPREGARTAADLDMVDKHGLDPNTMKRPALQDPGEEAETG